MTTFTSEDRISSTSFTQHLWPEFWTNAKDYRQSEIQFFFPLTEQIELDLDYGPTHLHYRAKGIAGVHSMPIQGTTYEFTTVATNIAPQLTITPNNSVGEIHIGNIRVGLEKKPSWYQRVMYRLLGFNWRNK